MTAPAIFTTGAGADRQPFLARSDEHGNRFYVWLGQAYWSVTTIIGGGVPKHLVAWAVKHVANLVLEDLLTAGPHSRGHAAVRRWTKAGRAWVEELQAAGQLKSIKLAKLPARELAERWLKGQPERIRDAAAQRGRIVHAEAEDLVVEHALEATALVLEGEPLPEYSDEIRPYMGSFVRWVDEWHPVFLAAEATVFHRAQAYGGTLDAIVQVARAEILRRLPVNAPLGWIQLIRSLPDLVTIVVDYKSGNEVYPDVGLQLAAYSRAEFIGLRDGRTELPVPRADIGAVLHLTPAGYRFRLVRIDDPVWQSFLYAREVYRWATELSKTVLGPVLELPVEEVTS